MEVVMMCVKSDSGALCMGITCPLYDQCFPKEANEKK